MDLLISNLVSNHILMPAEFSCGYMQQFEIHNIAEYEQGCNTFFDTMEGQTLVFFPYGTISNLAQEHISLLKDLSCAVVLYEDDPLVAQSSFFTSLTNIPVFLIGGSTTISQAIAQCYHFAYSGIQKLAEVSLETMERLFKELFQHKGDSENIIKTAVDLMECPVAFSTSDFHIQKAPDIPPEYLVVNPFCAEDSFDWDLALDSFQIKSASYHPCLAKGINNAQISGYLYQNKYCHKQGLCIFIFPVTDTNNCYGYLFLSLNDNVKTLSPEKGIKIQQILAILKFEIVKSDEIAHTVNRYYDFLLDELIESDQTDFRKLMQKYGLVQKVIYEDYYVLIAGRSLHSTSDTFFHELLTSQQFNSLYGQLVNVLGTINFFLFERKDCIVTFLPKQLIADTKNDFLPIISIFRQFLQKQYQGAGISDAVPTNKVRQGYLQALKALAISQHSSDKAPCLYSDLGILKYFFDHSNQVDFTPLLLVYHEYILPIIEYDKLHNGKLFYTLTAYISYCSSPSAICSALYIHKNTLYYRLNKISEILGKNLTDNETIFNISLGLKIQALIQAGIIQNDLDP